MSYSEGVPVAHHDLFPARATSGGSLALEAGLNVGVRLEAEVARPARLERPGAARASVGFGSSASGGPGPRVVEESVTLRTGAVVKADGEIVRREREQSTSVVRRAAPLAAEVALDAGVALVTAEVGKRDVALGAVVVGVGTTAARHVRKRLSK